MTEPVVVPISPSPWRFLRTRRFWLANVVVIAVGLLSYYFEDVKDQFPPLVSAQLWAYAKMSHMQARPPRPKWVVGVEVDYDTFFGDMKRAGPEDITDRMYLAQVVRNAVDANAAVIALDINLVREETNAGSNDTADAALWQAIQYAASRKVPVVLTFAFHTQSMRPLNNIFGEKLVPLCADPVDAFAPRAGFDHAPDDRRQVPLVVIGHPAAGGTGACRSFSLQIVDAYEAAIGMPEGMNRKTTERLAELIEDRRFAFITFMTQNEFGPPISARLVYHKDSAALDRLRHRIVIIGGNRTGWPTDYVNPSAKEKVDYHRNPEDLMAGMYMHGNYVEGLLDDRYLAEFPRLLGAAIDMLLAAFIIVATVLLRGWLEIAVVALLLLVPIALSLALLDRGYSFDWVLPVLLSFLHPAIEKYFEIISDPLRRHAHE